MIRYVRHKGGKVLKKFITAVPLQPEGKLEEYCYAAVGNQRLQMQEKTSFPIITAIQG